MTALQLYKFIKNNGLEYHWLEEKDNVFLFIDTPLLSEWTVLLGHHILDEEGIVCTMKDRYFCFGMSDICDHFNIDMEDVFEKEKVNE